GKADIVYSFQFQTTVLNPETFLYNTGPIMSPSDPAWNRQQRYTVTRSDGPGASRSTVLGSGLACPPCNIGPLSTPDYAEALAKPAVHDLGNGVKVFAGQRAEGFYVDLGAIFDLGILRPFEQDHTTFGLHNTGLGAMAAGVNATKALNVHSIALQVPKNQLTRGGVNPTSVAAPTSVIGVWTTASRQRARILAGPGAGGVEAGPFVQVSRLGNPLINEVVIPMGDKDRWNATYPSDDAQFLKYYTNPELARLLPVLYPGVFPNLAAYNAGPPPPNRADLVAILLTGIPAGLVDGFQNFTGATPADMLRLNLAIGPTTSGASNLGLLGGDAAGFPNGRRVFDDVVTIEVQAIAGAVLGLVDPGFKADGATSLVNQGLTANGSDLSAIGTENYLGTFPYLGVPLSGFAVPAA
ncbi:MAG TPA: DUF4331 domain-containing protein, partial [Acidimicrobiales bacterium]|nr:DUF4331 domain-containing protein [Acidimicrobiales bacterium]